MKTKLILTFVFASCIAHAGQNVGDVNYFDFNTQSFVSKDVVNKKLDKVQSCTNEANERVRQDVSEGYIPVTGNKTLNSQWVSAFQQDYIRQCLSR